MGDHIEGIPGLKVSLSDDDDDEEEENEEKKLMSILMKLKNAKKTIDDSKKRKRTKQVREDAIIAFVEENKVIQSRFKRKKLARSSKLTSASDKVRGKIESMKKQLNNLLNFKEELLILRRDEADKVLSEFKQIEASIKDVETKILKSLGKDYVKVKNQILLKMSELSAKLTSLEASKEDDDSFSRLIDTMMLAF